MCTACFHIWEAPAGGGAQGADPAEEPTAFLGAFDPEPGGGGGFAMGSGEGGGFAMGSGDAGGGFAMGSGDAGGGFAMGPDDSGGGFAMGADDAGGGFAMGGSDGYFEDVSGGNAGGFAMGAGPPPPPGPGSPAGRKRPGLSETDMQMIGTYRRRGAGVDEVYDGASARPQAPPPPPGARRAAPPPPRGRAAAPGTNPGGRPGAPPTVPGAGGFDTSAFAGGFPQGGDPFASDTTSLANQAYDAGAEHDTFGFQPPAPQGTESYQGPPTDWDGGGGGGGFDDFGRPGGDGGGFDYGAPAGGGFDDFGRPSTGAPDPFAAGPTSPGGDPFGQPADPFAAQGGFGGGAPDPFGGGGAPADPFGGGGAPADPFGGGAPADPFGAPAAPGGEQAGGDPFGWNPFAEQGGGEPGAGAGAGGNPFGHASFESLEGEATELYEAQAPDPATDEGPPDLPPPPPSIPEPQAAADDDLFELDVPAAPIEERRAPANRGAAPARRRGAARGRRRRKKKQAGARIAVIVLAGIIVVGLGLGLTDLGFFGINAILGDDVASKPKGSVVTGRAVKKRPPVLVDTPEAYAAQIKKLERELKRDKDDVGAQEAIADTLVRFKERYPAAFRGDPAMERRYKTHVTAKLLGKNKAIQIRSLLAAEKVPDAAAVLQKWAGDAETLSADQHYLLARALFLGKGEPGGALQHYEAAYKAAPEMEAALFDLGRVQQRLGQFEEARKSFEDLLKKNPKHGGAHLHMGQLTLADNQVDKTREHLKRALKMAEAAKDKDAQYLAYRLGAALDGKTGNTKLQIQALENALDLRRADEETALQLADLLVAEKRTKEALTRLLGCRKAGCKSAAFHSKLVEVYQHLGRRENAKTALAEAIAESPTDPKLLMLRATMFKEDKKYASAQRDYQEVINSHPGLAPPYLELAELQAREGRNEHALATLRKGIEEAGDKITLQERLARLQTAIGQLDEARKTMKAILDEQPDRYDIKLRYANLLKDLKFNAEAAADFAELDDKGKLTADDRTAYADVLFRLGKFEESLAQLDQIFGADQAGNVEATILRGAIYTSTGEYQMADEQLRRALKVNSESAMAYHYLGLNELAQGRLTPAAEYLGKATDLSPSDMAIRYDLARALTAIGGADNRTRAINQYSHIIKEYAKYKTPVELKKRNPDVFKNRGELYFEEGQFHKALADFMESIDVAPERLDLKVVTARALQKVAATNKEIIGLEGEKTAPLDEARRLLVKVLEQDGTFPAAHFEMGNLLLETNRKDAINHFQRVIEADPQSFPDAYLRLGYLHKDGGRKAAACGNFKQYLRLAPRDAYDVPDVAHFVAKHCRR